MNIFLLLLSILPAAVILLYLYKKDKYEKEPLSLLIGAFALGIAAAIPVVIWGILSLTIIPFSGIGVIDAFRSAFIDAAIPEELAKFAALYLLVWKSRYFNEAFDGIIYAVFVSLGFATLENILYVYQGGMGVGIMRAILSVPGHALFGVVMGYYFSYARFLPQKKEKYLWLSILVPVALHGGYDFLLFLTEKYPFLASVFVLYFLGIVALMWVLGMKNLKKLSYDNYYKGLTDEEFQEKMLSPYIGWEEIPYIRNWHDIQERLFKQEGKNILQKYPDAVIKIEKGIVNCNLYFQGNFSWAVQLVYARNYARQPQHLRLYVTNPGQTGLVPVTAETPYVKTDPAGKYYIDVLPVGNTSGVRALDSALEWIILFEKWTDGSISTEEFIMQ